MHSALRVVELVQMIFEDVGSPIDGAPAGHSVYDTRLATLAALARTCKEFQDLALDVLWRNQESLVILLCCMPFDVWGLKPRRPPVLLRDATLMSLRRPIKRSDWDRVLFYSSRIRELTLCQGNEEVWELVRPCIPPGISLFPNLRHLHWAMNTGLVSTIPDFLAPRLISIDLHVHGWQLSNLHNLAAILPSPIQLKIQQLSLPAPSPTDPHPMFLQQASLFIRGMNMTRLEATNLNASALLHISQLPLLTFLSLRPDFIHSPTFSRSSFPALRTLELTCNRNPNDALCNSNHLVSFIKSCENWKLESISVELAPTPAILEAIHAHCAHSTLTRLEVGIGLYHYTHAFIWNYDSTIVPSSAMQPLLSFTRLRALSLKSPVGIDLDTTTFWRMASAWPDLESLALTADIPAPKLGLAFDALRALAENCPRLRSLSIPISAVSKIPGFCVVLPPKERRVALVAAHPWLSAHAVVAEFASHLYPYPQMGADDVHWQDNEGDGEEESDEDGDEHENGDGCGSGGESGEEVGYGDEDSDCSWE